MTDTYDKRCQLGASRRRFEDARCLHSQKRWAGAIYLGGYAIECSLKSLICYEQGKRNFKETQIYKKGLQGSDLHSLAKLSRELPTIQRAIELDRTNTYRPAWNLVLSLWLHDELRYSDKMGDEQTTTQFIKAVEIWHRFLLNKQNET